MDLMKNYSKLDKVVKPKIRKHYDKTLGTSVINSPMSSPSLMICSSGMERAKTFNSDIHPFSFPKIVTICQNQTFVNKNDLTPNPRVFSWFYFRFKRFLNILLEDF